MNRKMLFAMLLTAALVSSLILVGLVSSSNGGPKITVSPMWGTGDSKIDIKGIHWVPGQPVVLYWDEQDMLHAIANATVDKSGEFKVHDLTVEGSYIGPHTVIAVQGLSMATATYTMKATTTPDDRILSSLQTNFTTILDNVTAIEGKLDNATSGLPGIQTNLTKIDTDANNHPGFYSNQGSWYNRNMGYGQYPVIEAGHDFNSSEFTITIYALSNVSAVDIMIYTEISVPSVAYLLDVAPINQPLFMGDFEGSISYTCAAQWVLVTINPVNPSEGANVSVQWSITAETPPGVGITWVPF